MGFKDKLKETLKGQLSVEDLPLLPKGFQTIGMIMILKLNLKLLDKKNRIGKACLQS